MTQFSLLSFFSVAHLLVITYGYNVGIGIILIDNVDFL